MKCLWLYVFDNWIGIFLFFRFVEVVFLECLDDVVVEEYVFYLDIELINEFCKRFL